MMTRWRELHTVCIKLEFLLIYVSAFLSKKSSHSLILWFIKTHIKSWRTTCAHRRDFRKTSLHSFIGVWALDSSFWDWQFIKLLSPVKEFSINSALFSCNTAGHRKGNFQKEDKNWCSRSTGTVFYIPLILLPCQTLAPTLFIKQLDLGQFSRTFRCVMLADAEVALSLEPQAEMRSRLQRFCKLAAFWLQKLRSILFQKGRALRWHHLWLFL